MLMRVFSFTPDQKGRADFRVAYEAFRVRDPQKCTKDERKYLAEIQRALDGVSDPVGELPDDAEIDGRMRKLTKAGGTIRISQKSFEKLETFVEETPFQAVASVAAEDFRDRWGTAAKEDADSAQPAKPHRVGKAG